MIHSPHFTHIEADTPEQTQAREAAANAEWRKRLLMSHTTPLPILRKLNDLGIEPLPTVREPTPEPTPSGLHIGPLPRIAQTGLPPKVGGEQEPSPVDQEPIWRYVHGTPDFRRPEPEPQPIVLPPRNENTKELNWRYVHGTPAPPPKDLNEVKFGIGRIPTRNERDKQENLVQDVLSVLNRTPIVTSPGVRVEPQPIVLPPRNENTTIPTPEPTPPGLRVEPQPIVRPPPMLRIGPGGVIFPSPPKTPPPPKPEPLPTRDEGGERREIIIDEGGKRREIIIHGIPAPPPKTPPPPKPEPLPTRDEGGKQENLVQDVLSVLNRTPIVTSPGVRVEPQPIVRPIENPPRSEPGSIPPWLRIEPLPTVEPPVYITPPNINPPTPKPTPEPNPPGLRTEPLPTMPTPVFSASSVSPSGSPMGPPPMLPMTMPFGGGNNQEIGGMAADMIYL